MITCSILFFCDLISSILAFLYHCLHVLYRVFLLWVLKMSFCTGMYTIPTRKQAKSRKKWVITWIRSQLQWSQKQLILVITTTTPYLHPPLTCLLSACSDNNIIISYTTLIRRAEENRVSSTQQPTTSTSNKPLVDDLIYPPPWWCGLQ